jgi:hypothetical protein
MGLQGHLGHEPSAWVGGSGLEHLLIKTFMFLERAQRISTFSPTPMLFTFASLNILFN